MAAPVPPLEPVPDRPSAARPSAPQPSIAQLDSRLRRYCRSLTKSRWDAEDLAQDAWLKALRVEGFRQHPNPEALLVRIAKNTWIDRLRRQATGERLAPLADQVDTNRVTDGGSHPHDALAVQEAFEFVVRHLSPLQRSVLVLRDVLGFSVRETAALLQTSEGAVKAALHRARRALASTFERDESDRLQNREDGGARRGMKPRPTTSSPAVDSEATTLSRAMATAYLEGDVTRLVRMLVPGQATGTHAGEPVMGGLMNSVLPVRADGWQAPRPLAFLCRWTARRHRRRFAVVGVAPARGARGAIRPTARPAA